MRTRIFLRAPALGTILTALAVVGLAAQHQHDPDKSAQGTGKLPAGWQARLDQPSAKVADVIVAEDKGAMTFTTGPAGIYYKPEMKGEGAYEVSATFSQLKPSAHPEAYGLFVGGKDLDKDTQHYTYFLIRQDGKYLIKSRDGSTAQPIVDWTPAPPMKDANVAKQGFKDSNQLAIRVEPGKVFFLIGGTEVRSLPRAQIATDGIAGIRINHNLNVQVSGFDLKKQN
jgi:hypothetical protein